MENSNADEAPLTNFLTLPIELIVYILSFLTSRDIFKLRCVSRKLRSVSETPSLWRECVWPLLTVSEERCVDNVLKACGQYVKRLCLPDHAPTPAKMIRLLQHCKDLKELCIPTWQVSFDKLEKAMQFSCKLQYLDIPWTSDIGPILASCNRLKELTIRVVDGKKRGWILSSCFFTSLDSWLDKWVMEGFLPQSVKLVVGRNIPLTPLVKHWLRLNPSSPTDHSGCLTIFSSLKVPMDLFPPLPFLQLQFGQSCTLPFLKPNKCGLLGLEEWDLLLTSTTYHGQVINKAKMIKVRPDIGRCHFSSDITAVTQFDASECKSLHSGHLEQLAMACPKLQHLDLKDNVQCLERLHGLHELLNCSNLRALSLLGISKVENFVHLWKILVDMKLFYLAIEVSVLIPWVDDEQVDLDIIRSYRECLNLKAMEIYNGDNYHSHIRRNLSALSNFPSLVYCKVVNRFSSPVDVELVINGCAKLKYLSSHSTSLSHCLTRNVKLEQLYLDISYRSSCRSSSTDIITFMQSVSAHGGLVRVVLHSVTLYDDGIVSLIENSPKLFTCHLTVSAHVRSQKTMAILNMRDFRMTLKQQFHDRKLFTGGDFCLSTRDHDQWIQGNTDIVTSLWPQVNYW